MELFQNIIIFLIGAMFGSAANALIDRLPRKESWFEGRSHCDNCGHVLEFKDLIPIFSYLSLLRINNTPPHPFLNLKGGRRRFLFAGCRSCHSPIPVRNFLVEVFMGMGFITLSYFGNLNDLETITLMAILWVTTIIAVMDWETKLVSEWMVAGWVILVSLWRLGSLGDLNYLVGVIAGVSLIGGIWAATRGKAMGFGDVEIAAVMGWWLGWPKIWPGLWIAFVVGAIVGSYDLLTGKKKLKSEIAFGPFLVFGSWIGQLWGDKIIRMLGF